MTISIRLLEEEDLLPADDILRLAFHSSYSRVTDLQLYRRLQPDGWWVAAQDKQLAGLVGMMNYEAYAYVGFMAVHPKHQRQGIGLTLMQILLDNLKMRGVPVVVLDASTLGRPLYEKLGFISYQDTLTFQSKAGVEITIQPAAIQSISARDMDELVQWDAAIFGADRSKVLHGLLQANLQRSFLVRDKFGKISGYLIAQTRRIGPWVARRAGDAELLLQAALSLPYEDNASLFIPSENKAAADLMERYGFEHVNTTCHMGKGQAFAPGDRSRVFSQSSLTVG